MRTYIDYDSIGFYLIPTIYLYKTSKWMGIEIMALKWEIHLDFERNTK